jgi:cell division protein FtsB
MNEQGTSRLHWILLGLVICCLLFIVSYMGRLSEQARLQAEIAFQETEIAQARARQAELTAYRDYVRSDAYIHEQARNVFNMVQPGDELIIAVTPSEAVASNDDSPVHTMTTPSSPYWQQWLELFLPSS